MSATPQQPVEVGEGQHEHPEHPVGAVDQGEALLGPQRHRRDAGLGQRRRAVDQACRRRGGPRPRRAAPSAADGQRGEVAAGTERAVLADDRRDPGVEQRDDRLDDLGPGPGEAHRQAAGAQEHHRPHDLALDLRAHAGGVRADQRRSAARPTARRGSRCWPAPRSPVDTPYTGSGLVDQPLDHGGAPGERARGRRRRASTRPAVPGDGDHVGGGHAARTELDGRRSRRRRTAQLPEPARQWRLTPPYFMRVSLIAAGRASSSSTPAATTSPTKSVCVPRSWAGAPRSRARRPPRRRPARPWPRRGRRGR